MFKLFKRILLFLVLFIFNISFASAKSLDMGDNLVNIYLFYSDTCPHCRREEILLNELIKENDNIKLYKYEISDKNNSILLDNVSKLFDTDISGVPFTVIGDTPYKGYSEEDSKPKFLGTIEYYSKFGYTDRVGEYLNDNFDNDIILQSLEIDEDNPKINEYLDEYNNFRIKIPLFGIIETKKLTLPVISLVIGLIDGFNPCAMWVLLFLISMLIGMNDKKKMILLGTTFLLSSAFIYFLFMISWLNVASFLLSINLFRFVIGLIAIGGACINIISYFKHRKDNGCNVVDDKKRNKIFTRIKKFTHEKNILLAIIGVIFLAFSVNIVELACSAGLPLMFTQILSMNNLTTFEEILYIFIYMFFFLIDDIVIFLIAVSTMQLTGVSTKYGKISKLVGGLLLFIIGILLIFKPEWLMFNFQ